VGSLRRSVHLSCLATKHEAMSSGNYEYKTVNVSRRNKELYKLFTSLPQRASLATEKLSKEGWELTNTTSDFWGNPCVLTFRKIIKN
jgi:hypothetical protein